MSESGGDVAARKRRLTTEQRTVMEFHFDKGQRLESDRKNRIAAELGLDPHRVAVWFQNRRARCKKMKREEFSVKMHNGGVIVEKGRPESEVLAVKVIGKDREGASSNKPSSSLSVEATMEPLFLAEFGVALPINNGIEGTEWIDQWY